MKNRRVSSSPGGIAMSLHEMAKKGDPQVAPETLHLPEPVHARYREKLFLYRETNVLLALVDCGSPSSDVRGPLFEPVFGEYKRIIFWESSDHLIPARTAGFFGELYPILREARRQSVMAALLDLNVRMHPPVGNKYDFARDWSRNWFASISHRDLSSSPRSGRTNISLSKKPWKRSFKRPAGRPVVLGPRISRVAGQR
jgi:hypothetical protein